jgi:hypothetical protein
MRRNKHFRKAATADSKTSVPPTGTGGKESGNEGGGFPKSACGTGTSFRGKGLKTSDRTGESRGKGLKTDDHKKTSGD